MHKILKATILAILLILGVNANARVYLVSVGIADYTGFPFPLNNLNLTVNDAKAVASLYAQTTSVDYALLLNEKATGSRILEAIEKVFSKANENDIVVFFFSGHGFPGGFCAYDTALTYDDVRNAFSKSRCKNKMMFVDACQAGGMRNDDDEAQQSSVSAAKKANVLLFLSSRDDESSIENRTMRNGFFTSYLIKGLNGAADANHDKTVTARELYRYVHKGVVNLSSGRQHPVMWGKFSDNMPVIRIAK